MYLVIDVESNEAAAVDPVDVDAIQEAASDHNATITTILTTHNHWDHSGGNVRLVSALSTIDRVYGGVGDDVPAATHEVEDGDTFTIGKATKVKVLFTPCHTPGHVCYYVDKKHIFTGDTMFISGCGNFNNGTPAQMVEAFDKLLSLPDETKVWVGHEYTAKNCAFACYADQDNTDLRQRLQWAKDQGSPHTGGGKGTIPSTIAMEKKCNPFARIDHLSMMKFCGACGDDRSERMRLVRKGKDDWGRR